MNPQFADALADGRNITKISVRQAFRSNDNFRNCAGVA